MKKRFFSILLCFCMVLGLLPAIAFAADPIVTIGSTDLTDGKYYTVKTGEDITFALVEETVEQPTEGTPYLYFSGGTLTVTGNVSLTSGGFSPLSISNDRLTIAGSGSLSLSCSGAATVEMNNATLSLAESVNFSTVHTSGAAAIQNGTVETEEGFSGNITISSTGTSALYGMTSVNLQTSGDISLSGRNAPVISTEGAVTLEGKSVNVSSGNGMLISSSTGTISITATESGLSLTGASSAPLLVADNITLFANGNIQVENTGNDSDSMAISGNLTVTEAQDVTVSSSGAQAIGGTANITVAGDVAISSNNVYAVRGLTVNGAKNVTVIANQSPAPAIGEDVDIKASGDINIQNTGVGLTIGAAIVFVETTEGSITIQSEGTGPVIDVTEAITLKAKGNIEVTGSNSEPSAIYAEGVTPTLISTNGVVKLTDKNGTSITLADGVALKEISGGLDLSQDDHSTKTVEADGYSFSGTTLTLGNAYVSGSLTLPDNAIITTPTNSVIGGSISPQGNAPCELTFNGNGSLTVNGGIGNAQGGTMTVSGGADVIVNGSVNIGTSGGADGTLNVTGEGTTLNVSSSLGYAVLFETVNVTNGANLSASAGEGAVGVRALEGGVHVTGGSTLTTGCAYGVYIVDGKLEVDSTSKLITNGAIAPFCVVDTTSTKSQSNMIELPGLPSGMEISSVQGTTEFIGKKYTYWSLIKNETLGVKDENQDGFATLTGAVQNTLLTFQKVAKKPSSDSGSSGGANLTRTLTFKTNGGSEIANVSKTSGTVVALKEYKPTRDGYTFDGWYSDEALTKKVSSITLTASTTVYAKWTENEKQVEETKETKNPFTDVKDSDYFYDAVQWAVEKNVTSGTSSDSFSPSVTCTRAQMVTFLWKAMGSLEPTTANCPFTDVSKDAYYYKAVLWAVENDITSGATATTFAPNATVTRGQTVTFLWRVAGKPMATIANPYTDVVKGAYNYDAVLWAAEKGITQGTSATTFSPDSPCTRAQIVTFLYKYIGK